MPLDVGDVAPNYVNKYLVLFSSCILLYVIYYLLCLVFVITCPGHCIRHSMCPDIVQNIRPLYQNFKTKQDKDLHYLENEIRLSLKSGEYNTL